MRERLHPCFKESHKIPPHTTQIKLCGPNEAVREKSLHVDRERENEREGSKFNNFIYLAQLVVLPAARMLYATGRRVC